MCGGAGETREELLDLAKARGYEVTEHQLARWHRAGLLLRPKQRSLGKGHGTQTVYPPGTGKQLLRLCEIHFDDEEKRLLHVGWRLWWEGYKVSFQLIRSFLDRLAVRLDKERSLLADPESEELSDVGWKWVEDSRKSRLGPPLGGVRRRTSRKLFPTVMKMLVEVLAGLYAGYQVEHTEDHPEGTTDRDRQIIEGSFGLDQGRTDQRSKDPEQPNKPLETTLKEISSMFRDHSLQDVVAAATDEELAEVRNQLRLMFAVGRLIAALAEQIPDPEALVLRERDKDLQQMGPPEQAFMVLVLTMWRLWGPPGARERMDSHYEELQQRHLEAQQAIAQLRKLGWDIADI